MRHKIFSIWDDKAKAFLPPFYFPETGMAVRAFRDGVRMPDHAFCRNPEDYTLFLLGEFEDSSGVLTPLHAIERVIGALELTASGQRELLPSSEVRAVNRELLNGGSVDAR